MEETTQLTEEQEYWNDVSEAVKILTDEAKAKIEEEGWNDTDNEDDLAEWLNERLDEFADGCQRVIYTHQAKMCCVYSRHEDAALESFGADGLVDDGGINWSLIALYAFRADIQDDLPDPADLLPEWEEPEEDDEDED